MNIPVANWRQQIGVTSVFWDLVDRDLRLYGPRVIWRALQRHSIGAATILSGVVSFGYMQEEIAALAQQLPGKRLAPLVPSGVFPSTKISIPIAEPNKASLTLTPSIPFPDLRFSATVQTPDRSGDGIADEIQQHWEARTLIDGAVDFTFDMRTAVGGYETIIDYRSCAAWLVQQPASSEGFMSTDAVALITKFIAQNATTLIVYIGLDEQQTQRQLVAGRLGEMLFQGTLFANGTLIEFDNGEKLGRWSVHPPNTLVAASKQIFVHTEPISEPMNFTFH